MIYIKVVMLLVFVIYCNKCYIRLGRNDGYGETYFDENTFSLSVSIYRGAKHAAILLPRVVIYRTFANQVGRSLLIFISQQVSS